MRKGPVTAAPARPVAIKWQRSHQTDAAKPHLDATLAALIRGRVVYLTLTREQRRTLSDRDGQIALNVLRHLLAARVYAVVPNTPREPFPLTDGVIATVARKLGTPVGIKRARNLRRRLIATKIIQTAGTYRPAYRIAAGDGTHRVTLHTLAINATGYVTRRARRARHKVQASVGRGSQSKGGFRRRWWSHPLFGTLDGLPPPDLTARQRRAWRSVDERMRSWR